MWLLILEALAALALLVGMVWWVMFSGRRRGERADLPAAEAPEAEGRADPPGAQPPSAGPAPGDRRG